MDYHFLAKTLLFQGIPPEEIASMLTSLGAQQRNYPKGVVILHAGEPTQSMGLVLSGQIQIESNDLWGNKSILDHVAPGFVFAETYACLPDTPLMVNVVAIEPAEVLFLTAARLFQTSSNRCANHEKLLHNLLYISMQKNLNLSRRIYHTSSKTIRGRLLSYLSFQATLHGSPQFTIPFNRQQLADYLGVDRSALSAELGKMQREGLLTTTRNSFDIKDFIEP